VTQAQTVADALSALTSRPAELVLVTTEGDTSPGSLVGFGGVGVFVGAVREAIVDGRADVGVHSLKDLPTAPHPDLVVVATPVREDPRDAFCGIDGATLADLPVAATVGTGSPRRASQLRALRPDLNVIEVRGNVDTRLHRVSSGDLDAVILAAAGLARLDRTSAVTEFLEPDQMLPAPGQGSLGVEAAGDLAERDPDLHKALCTLDDFSTHVAVDAERAVLNALEAGCTAPVGALATVTPAPSEVKAESEVHLQAMTAAVDGSQMIRMSITGNASQAAELGRELAALLLAAGAADLLGEHE
jgi:hydroxymethylbilane synthase